MQNQSENLRGLVDIEPPLEPHADWQNMTIVGTTLLLILVLLVIVVKLMMSRKTRARRALRKLTSDHYKNNISLRSSLFSLMEILKTGFAVKKISSVKVPVNAVANSEHRWQQFVEKLEAARYGKQEPASEVVNNLLIEARYWLN